MTTFYESIIQEKHLEIIAKIAAIKLLHRGKFAKWTANSEEGIIDVEVFEEEREDFPTLYHPLCRCHFDLTK